MRLGYLFLALIAVLALSACTSSESTNTEVINTIPSSAPLKEIRITAYEWGFDQEDVEIHKGDHVRIILTSRSGTHGLTLAAFGISSAPVSPGQEQEIDFIVNDAGTFDYFCNVPCGSGHNTMRGQLTVLP